MVSRIPHSAWTRRWQALAAAAVALGCGCTAEVGDDDAVDDGFELSIEPSALIPTVATAEWSTSLGAVDEAAVVFTLDGGEARRAPVDLAGGPPYRVALLGMKAQRDYTIHVEATVDGEGVASDGHTWTSGAIPTEMPGLTMSPGVASPSSPFVLTSIFAGTPSPVIVDADGDVVWWHVEREREASVSRAQLSRRRGAVLYLTRALGGPDQELVEVALDGSAVVRHPLPGAHHDFLERPDGTLAVLAADTRQVLGEDVEGDQLLEIDVDGGPPTVIYSVWDDFVFDPETDSVEGIGWSHANAVDLAADGDSYYLSLLGFDSIVKVDRAGGGLRWVMGGADSDYTLADGSTELYVHEHQFQLLDGSILVFDNGDPARNSSRAVEYAFVEGEREVTEIWSFTPDPEVFSFSLGDVHRFDNGHTLVDFSAAGQMMEITAHGEIAWQLNVGLGGALGYATPLDSLY